MYESMIKVIQDDLEMQLEGEILKSVKRAGIDVDRDELIRALRYDREQYEKGFEDARKDAVPVVRCKACEYAERYERTNGTAGYYCGHPRNTFTYGERWDRVFKPVKEANDFCSYGETE